MVTDERKQRKALNQLYDRRKEIWIGKSRKGTKRMETTNDPKAINVSR